MDRSSRRDSEYCEILVAINSVLQMVLYAPLALLFIKFISREKGTLDIEYSTFAKSVAVFLGIPLWYCHLHSLYTPQDHKSAVV